jgi:transcriptional regulator with XRE-family HTH domain
MVVALCARLKELRNMKGVLQSDVAKMLDVSTRAYRHYENGDREPNIFTLITLADFFNVSLDYLVGRSDNLSGARIIPNMQ